MINDNNADDSNRGLNELRVKTTAVSVWLLVWMNTQTLKRIPFSDDRAPVAVNMFEHQPLFSHFSQAALPAWPHRH